MKPPFPYFGGKRRAAPAVWAALGDVANYIEPFAGSLGVLLNRPAWHRGYVETVNDMDAWIVNFFRAAQAAPEEVARHADNPVNETDLEARHIWLVTSGRERIARLASDPEFYDAKVAGWWAWGLCCWIGSGWCSGDGPWVLDGDGLLANSRQLPNLNNAGRGINRKLPHLGDAGQGIRDYMQALALRLRRVRVCCGDWTRVVTDGAMAYAEPHQIGVFLDPPYSHDVGRETALYAHEMPDTLAIREWCVRYQEKVRIVLAGYDGEYDLPGWSVVNGKAGGGSSYGTAKMAERGEAGAQQRRERLWLSPLCDAKIQKSLFSAASDHVSGPADDSAE